MDSLSSDGSSGDRDRAPVRRRPRISVIIPVLDQWQYLQRCLESIHAQQRSEEVEILVVDNGSQAPPPHRIQQLCTAVLTCELGGSYAARNRGLKEARGEIIVFTDADCVPDTGWLQAGVDQMQMDRAPDIVAGRIDVYPEGDAPTDVERYDMAYGFRQRSFVRRGFGVTGNLFVTMDVLAWNGPFREDLYSGGDKEWCLRAVRRGASIVYCEEALVWHPARKDFRELKRRTRRLVGGRWRRGGRGWRRSITFLGLMVPPLTPIGAAIAPTRRGIRDRLAFIRVSMFVWMVKVTETIRLIAGGPVERR